MSDALGTTAATVASLAAGSTTPGAGAHVDVDPDAAIAAARREGRDVLCFKCWQGNKPCALPGNAPGDHVRRPDTYQELTAAAGHVRAGDWRAVFSDMWEGEKVRVWGRTYRTHQHAFQSAKFISVGLVDVADRFTIDSGDSIGQSPANQARRAGNTVAKLTADQWVVWENARSAMKDDIYAAKYQEGTKAARVLVATNDALLINSGKKKVVCVRLMQQRAALLSVASQAQR